MKGQQHLDLHSVHGEGRKRPKYQSNTKKEFDELSNR